MCVLKKGTVGGGVYLPPSLLPRYRYSQFNDACVCVLERAGEGGRCGGAWMCLSMSAGKV